MQNDKQKFKNDFQKRLINFSLAIIGLCEQVETKRTSLKIIANQLLRSATSIGANVTEASGSASTKDYARFFEIALKSANESKYWLILLLQSEPTVTDEAERLFNECDELARIIAASILTMRGKR